MKPILPHYANAVEDYAIVITKSKVSFLDGVDVDHESAFILAYEGVIYMKNS
jgi:hypothetical protein